MIILADWLLNGMTLQLYVLHMEILSAALKHLKRGTNMNKLVPVEVLCFELPFGTETQPFFIPIFGSATEPTNCFRLEHCHFLAEPQRM